MNIFIRFLIVLTLNLTSIASYCMTPSISYLMSIPKEIRVEIVKKLIHEFQKENDYNKALKLHSGLKELACVNKEFKNLLIGKTQTAQLLLNIKKNRLPWLLGYNHIKKVKILLAPQHVKVNESKKHNKYLLQRAINYDQIKIVKLLIKLPGININRDPLDGGAPRRYT